jgi:hypothetical protein
MRAGGRRVTNRGVRLIRGVDRHEGEPLIPPSFAHDDAANSDGLAAGPRTSQPLRVRVRQHGGSVAGQVRCRHFGNRKVRRHTLR